MKYLLLSFAAALAFSSCQQAVRTDLAGIRSVGVANGMGTKVTRNKIGTTVFNNSHETVEMPSLSREVSATAVKELKSRFGTATPLAVQPVESKNTLFGPRGVIDEKGFQEESVRAAKAQGLDAVWVIIPRIYSVYGARGPAFSGYEHRQDGMLGMAREMVSCVATAKLINVKTGAIVAEPSSGVALLQAVPFTQQSVDTRKWQKHLSEYDPASRNDITNALANVAKGRVIAMLDESGIVPLKQR